MIISLKIEALLRSYRMSSLPDSNYSEFLSHHKNCLQICSVPDNNNIMMKFLKKCIFYFYIQPKVVTDIEDEELKRQMEELQLANQEVAGDDDTSDQEVGDMDSEN